MIVETAIQEDVDVVGLSVLGIDAASERRLRNAAPTASFLPAAASFPKKTAMS
jgi:methylmalonyl-CoA mutase cobalamin-binding subunit